MEAIKTTFSISVIIPNFNGKHLLEKNIPYVYKALQTSEIVDFEIIVTDDASSDDSISFIQSNFPEIIVLANSVNIGFGGNCNRAMYAATKELIFFLNSDVQLEEGYFKPLVAYFNHEKCFGVMGSIWDESLTRLQDAAKYPNVSFGKINGATNYTIENSEQGTFSFFLSGANALIDREKLVELNGFEEAFNPYYFEDLDLGIRAWKLGYYCYFDPNAKCIHPISSTIKKEPSDKVKTIIERNRILIHFFHLSSSEWCFYQFKVIFKGYVKLLMGQHQLINGWRMFASKKTALKAKRAELQNSTIRLKDIKKNIEKSLKGEKTNIF
jgi:GT2 family glycosyltransferase